MVDNVEAVLSRGEKLDVLVDKTDGLMNEVGAWTVFGGGWAGWGARVGRRSCGPKAEKAAAARARPWRPTQPSPRRPPPRVCASSSFQADRFVKSGRALRRRMCWDNMKMKACVACVVLMALAVIVLLVCAGGEPRSVGSADGAGRRAGGAEVQGSGRPRGGARRGAPCVRRRQPPAAGRQRRAPTCPHRRPSLRPAASPIAPLPGSRCIKKSGGGDAAAAASPSPGPLLTPEPGRAPRDAPAAAGDAGGYTPGADTAPGGGGGGGGGAYTPGVDTAPGTGTGTDTSGSDAAGADSKPPAPAPAPGSLTGKVLGGRRRLLAAAAA
jgi:hypothetical protein